MYNESVSIRMGQVQLELEQVLSRDMLVRDIVDHVLKASTNADLPYRCFSMLEAWALRTYA